MLTVVVTGVGGPLGQALIKALRQSSLPTRVIGTDRQELSVGLRWAECGHVLPDSCRPDAYLAEMRRLCAAGGARAILPGSESELELLARAAPELERELGVVVVASPPEVLRTGLDKGETARFLERAGLSFPRTACLGSAEDVGRLVAELGFPLIAKPRRGSGSRGLVRVRSWRDIEYLRGEDAGYLLQEYLRPDGEEYTAGVYRTRGGRCVGAIAMRRELVAGNTYRAWVSPNEAVRAEACRVVEALRPLGPCNVQLRLTERGPVTFEVNPRFSGTTAMRAHFGYNEVEMALRDLVLGEPLPEPVIRPGVALRFWDETYLDG